MVHAAKTLKDLGLKTRAAVSQKTPAQATTVRKSTVSVRSKVCAAKYMVSQKTLTQGVVTPISKPTMSTSASKMKSS